MLGRLLGKSESRAVSYQQVWGSGGEWPVDNSWSGQSINQTRALQISTVYACVRLYTDTISTLPVAAFMRRGGVRQPVARPAWLDEPYPGVSWQTHVQQVLVGLLLNGNSYTRVYRNSIGQPVSLVVLNPQQVEPTVAPDGMVSYTWTNGTQRAVIEQKNMIHVTELVMPGEVKGVSRIDQVKQELGLAQAINEFSARFFGNGTTVSGVIETPVNITAEQAKQAKEVFESQHRGAAKSHGVAIIGGGGKFVKTSTAPDEAQMLESKAASVEAIARVFRVPPQKIGVTTPGAMSYASVEQMNQAFAIDSLRPYVEKLETAYSRLLPMGEFIKVNMDAVLRGDTQSRYSAYSQALTAGWASINDVRRLEDMQPIEGGDGVRVPLAAVDLAAANVVEQEKNVDMAVKMITAGADPTSVLRAFNLPDMDFTAATEARQLTIAEAVQKVYLGVGKVITSDEARQIVNEYGGDLSLPGPDFPDQVGGSSPRSIRRVERDANGYILRIVNEPEEQ